MGGSVAFWLDAAQCRIVSLIRREDAPFVQGNWMKCHHCEDDDETSQSSTYDENFLESSESLDHCQLQWWYPHFRQHTFKSCVIALPDSFVQYLGEDGVFLPNCGKDAPRLECEDMYESAEKAEKAAALAAREEGDADARSPHFPELEQQISKAISDLGGEVFPKLNWSSPKDSTWASASNTLKCYTPSDVFLLLKCSDIVSHDLFDAYSRCREPHPARPAQFCMVLREYVSMHQSNEFRCFVRGRVLIAISQRQNIFFPFLSREAPLLCALIDKFWLANVRDQFPEQDYVMDVYVAPKKRVMIVDFNVWGPSTMPLLFSWDELRDPAFPTPPPSAPGGAAVAAASSSPDSQQDQAPLPPPTYVVRLVSQGTIEEPRLPFEDELALATNRFPMEFLHLGRDGALEAVMKAAREQQEEDDDGGDGQPSEGKETKSPN